MLTTNINIEDRLINGQIGTVKQFEIKENEARTIYLELDDKCAGKIRMRRRHISKKIINGFQLKEKRLIYIYINKSKATSKAIKRTQFPLALSWACTVHKKQGLSLMSAVVSFDLENQKSFNEGQMYLALSRVTKIDNLFLIGKYSPNVFKVNENTVIEYSKLRESLFDRIYIDHADCNSLTVSLLNTRSLVRHAVDINRTKKLMENDILCLTESQITNDTDRAEIFEQLSTLRFISIPVVQDIKILNFFLVKILFC